MNIHVPKYAAGVSGVHANENIESMIPVWKTYIINTRSEVGRTIIVRFILELEVPMFISILILVQTGEIYHRKIRRTYDRGERISWIGDAGDPVELIKGRSAKVVQPAFNCVPSMRDFRYTYYGEIFVG